MADAQDKSAETQRVTAESYGSLDTMQVSEECWMIRVPPKLAELWEKVPEGTDLGELIFTKGGITSNKQKVKPSLTVHVAQSLVDEYHKAPPAPAASAKNKGMPKSTTMPLNYSLQAMTKKVPVMHPFVRDPNTSSIHLLGHVSRTANLQVEQDNAYRALLKDRLVATNLTSSRFVKPVEASESVIAKQRSTAALQSNHKKGFGDAVLKFGKRMLEASQESSQQILEQQQRQGKSKRARQFSPDQPVKSIIFELFGQKQHWSIKEMKAAAVAGGASHLATKRAETEIREILKNDGIGYFHRSGDHKNTWELRKEFQRQT